MSPTKDIRWQQRFQNYEKALSRLEEALEVEELSELEQNGLIQRFEFTLELCWNTLKDYLEQEGVVIKPPTPKETVREAFKARIVGNAQVLIDAILLRNILSHDYDGQRSEEAEEEIRTKIVSEFKAIHKFFTDKLSQDQPKLF